VATETIEFLSSVEPSFARGDLAALLARLEENWPPRVLEDLLSHRSPSVARLAAACLGMTGSMRHCPKLAALLSHPDAGVAAAAENALWNIWMRTGSGPGVQQLARAVGRIREGRFVEALAVLDDLALSEPRFAEVHHQRALALHSLERLPDAAEAYRRVAELNPWHFAAIAGLGHVCGQQGDLAGALRYYRDALKINPRLPDLQEIVPQIQAALERRNVA